MVTPLLAVSLTVGQWVLLVIGGLVLGVVLFAWIENEQTPAQREFRVELRARAATRRQRERDDYERRKARAAVACFYQRHVRRLEAEWPRERLQAHLESGIRPDTTPADAWAASRDLVAELSSLAFRRVEEESRQAAERSQRQRQLSVLDRRLAEERARLEQLVRSPLHAEVEDEVFRVQERIRELESEREELV